MDIYVRMKAPGKRRDVLPPTPYSIPDGIGSLRQLITAIARQEAEAYNRKEPDAQLIPFLTRQELEDQSRTGKVGFGRIFSEKKADPQKAAENALQCWEDGLIRVFMNDEELTQPDAPLAIPTGAVFTFMRLTFLSGTNW